MNKFSTVLSYTIKDAWLSYRATVVPVDAPEQQVDETRLAFYAGMFDILSHLRLMGEVGVDDTQAVKHLNDLYTNSKQACLDYAKKADKNG